MKISYNKKGIDPLPPTQVTHHNIFANLVL